MKNENLMLNDAEDEVTINGNRYYIWGFFKGVDEGKKYYVFDIENMKERNDRYLLIMKEENEDFSFFIESFNEESEQNLLEDFVTDSEEVEDIKAKLISFVSWH